MLAEPAFRHLSVSTSVAPQRSILQLIASYIVDHFLRPLFAPLARVLSAAHDVGTAAGVVLVVLALAVLGFAIVRLALCIRASRARRPRPRRARAPARKLRSA